MHIIMYITRMSLPSRIPSRPSRARTKENIMCAGVCTVQRLYGGNRDGSQPPARAVCVLWAWSITGRLDFYVLTAFVRGVCDRNLDELSSLLYRKPLAHKIARVLRNILRFDSHTEEKKNAKRIATIPLISTRRSMIGWGFRLERDISILLFFFFRARHYYFQIS